MEATVRRWSVLLAVILASMAVAEVTADYTKVRTRRGLIELGNMISSVTGKNLVSVYVSYNGYGCYCGIGGNGKPVDDVDRCCQKHDQCFEVAQNGVCSSSKKTVYNQSYKYSAQDKPKDTKGAHAKIECALVSSYKDVAQGRCAEAVCHCDEEVTMCFAKHKPNSKYSSYDRTKCK